MTTHIDAQSPSEPLISDEGPTAPLENPGQSETFWDNMPSLDLSDVQFRSIELTIQGLRDTQVAQTLGINRKTIWRWKTSDEDYRHALTTARTQLHATTGDRCQNMAQKATAILAGFLNEDVDDMIRLRAAQILLSTASRFKPITPTLRPQSPQEYNWPEPILEPKVG